ncbi:MAG: acyloxyacyl hydrolase [Bacteroidia bacterium]|nr:acyloxyacyl hydrolase [Bacteroidia bacterium]
MAIYTEKFIFQRSAGPFSGLLGCVLHAMVLGMALRPVAGWGQADWQAGISLGLGRSFRHSPAMQFELPAPALLAQAELMRRRGGPQPWRAALGYPRSGWAAGWLSYGNGPVLGFALGLYPLLELPLRERPGGSLWLRAGSGAAWVSRIYHPLDHPQQTALGSHLNNYSTLGLWAERPLGAAMQGRIGLQAHHQSNGRLRVPNLGMNTLLLQAGLRWGAAAARPAAAPAPHPAGPRPQFLLRAAFGARQRSYYSPVQGLGLFGAGLRWQAGPLWRPQAGISLMRDGSVRDDGIPPDTSRTSLALWGGPELLLGRLGLQGEIHLVLPAPPVPPRVMTRLAASWYPAMPAGDGPQPFLSIGLRARGFTAFCSEIGAGICL